MKPIILLACSWVSVLARTITVGPSGADHTTISAAVSEAAAGDVVEVADGHYDEQIVITASGTADNKLTLKAANSRQASCNGVTATGDYIRIEGFEIPSVTGSGTAIHIQGAYNEVMDNYVHGMYAGIRLQGRDSYAGYNYLYRCQQSIAVSGTNMLVEHNESERLIQHNRNLDADYCRFFGDSLVFRNNYFHGTSLSETGDAHVDCYQTYDNNGTFATNVLWEYNIMSDCHQGMISEGLYHNQNGNYTFRNNIFRDLAAFGVMGTATSNIVLLNNTFINCGSWCIALKGAATFGCVIKNNIFYRITDDAIKVTERAPVPEHSHNLYMLARFTVTLGEDDITGKWPLFVDRTSDFRLQADSPCIDAGADVGITDDFAGNPRTGLPDIGAYEWLGTGAIRTEEAFPRGAGYRTSMERIYGIDGRPAVRTRPGMYLVQPEGNGRPYRTLVR